MQLHSQNLCPLVSKKFCSFATVIPTDQRKEKFMMWYRDIKNFAGRRMKFFYSVSPKVQPGQHHTTGGSGHNNNLMRKCVHSTQCGWERKTSKTHNITKKIRASSKIYVKRIRQETIYLIMMGTSDSSVTCTLLSGGIEFVMKKIFLVERRARRKK